MQNNLPRKFTLKTFGNSMFPLLIDNDIVEIKKTSFNKLSVNDIVVFKKKDFFVTHRIIYKSNKFVVTRGDNNSFIDGKIKPSQIIGTVSKIKRNSKVINLNDIYFFQSTFYITEIIKITEDLNKNAINFLILKGLPLHLYYEKEHPKRIYADCDVLIEEKEFNKVKTIFESYGYHIVDTSLSKVQNNFFHQPKSEYTFIKYFSNGFSVVFDVHTEVVFMMTQLKNLNFLYSSKKKMNLTKALLSEKRYISYNNLQFPVLSHENLVLYLFLHLFHHNFVGVHRYYFIDSVLRKKTNFDEIRKKILTYNLQNYVYPTILLYNKYFENKIPPFLISAIKPKDHIVKQIKKSTVRVDIFQKEERFESGKKRFKLLYRLSPRNRIIKLLTFTNIFVLFFVSLTVYKKHFRKS